MENTEHQAIKIQESDSIEESSDGIEESSDRSTTVRSTNEIEENTNDASVIHMLEHLEEITREGIQIVQKKKGEGIQSINERYLVCSIYRVPRSLAGINARAIEPEIVSIGPYHRGKDEFLEFERYKWQFLHSLLSRTHKPRNDLLLQFRQAIQEKENEARECYSEPINMSSEEFIEMMLLDGCFIIELLLQVCGSDDHHPRLGNANNLMYMKPWLIPILARDLLKLENQIPFFILQGLFDLSVENANTNDPLTWLAFKFFNLAQPRSLESLKDEIYFGKHLLDLIRLSYLPKVPIHFRDNPPNLHTRRAHGPQEYDQSMPCATRLRSAGIKIRPRIDDRFLSIKFHKGVLEIPPITINDFTSTFLINCAALEQSCEDRPGARGFSAYIAFMSCLINSGRDVTFLCDDKIITNFSYNDLHVAHLFKKLGENVVFNIRQCYLSRQSTEVEAYYNSTWATLRRTHFSSPWSTISVVSAFVLLALTAIQTIMAIGSFKVQHG